MSGLSDLLQHLNTEGWSSRRIERETEKHGRKISYATVSRYLNGTHPRNPDAGTLQALADAFGVHVNELRNALGRPGVGEPFDLGEDGARLTGPQREAIRTTVRLFVEQNDALADRSQPDGATTGPIDTSLGRSDAGGNAHHRQRGSENEALRDDRPWEQDEYSLAAKRGRDRGREARQQQDREAEDGGA